MHYICQDHTLYLSPPCCICNYLSVPTNYDYLPEESLLRACADFLQQGAQQGPGMVPSWQLEVICTALTGDGSNALPPVNWATLIGPLLRLPYGEMIPFFFLSVLVGLVSRQLM